LIIKDQSLNQIPNMPHALIATLPNTLKLQ